MSAADTPFPPRRLRLASILAWALGGLILATPLNEVLSRPWVDGQLRTLAASAPIAGVTVIDIDESSLAALHKDFGSWPYRRDVYALAIDELRRAGVRAVALDLLLAGEREGDAALARELKRPGAPVLLPAIAQGEALGPAALTTLSDIGWPDLVMPSPSVLPAHELTTRVGVVTMPTDSDGYLRRWPLWHEAKGQRWPALPLAIWQATHRADAQTWPPAGPSGLTIPVGAAAGAVAQLPFSLVMEAALERVPRQALADRVRDHVVIVGASALLSEHILTPGGRVSGAEAVAQAYSALKSRRLAQLPRRSLDAALALLAGLPLLVAALRRNSSLRQDLLLLGLGGVAVIAATVAALWSSALLTQPAAAGVVILASALCLVAWRQRDLHHAQARLIEQRRLADQSSQAKSEFLANVSHEIRTPMNALLGAAELLSRSPLPRAEQQLVGLFTDAGQRLQTLLNDMLDLSRIEAGRLELHAEPFSLPDLLTGVSALVRPQAERKGLTLDVHAAEDLPPGVLGDSQRLQQVLLNLLSNAVTFTEHGGVTLDVQRDGDEVSFVVTDTGIGIAPNKLALIFEPFTQADGNLSRHYGGTGLGLSIVRQLVELMGGRVEAKSEPGQGSSFTLRIPLAQATLPAIAGAESKPAAAGSGEDHFLAGLRVLLVEDNDVNVVIFKAMLNGLGPHVDVAANGVEGLERLRTQTYDIAFVDIQMPVMDGLMMSRLFRQLEGTDSERKRMPLIALTANAYAADARLSMEAGCDFHISKPYDRKQLLDALKRFAPPVPAGRAPPTDMNPASKGGALPDVDIDLDAAVARLGSEEMFKQIKRHAMVAIGGWEADYLLAQRQGQRERQLVLAHNLKSLLLTVGATQLAQRARDLEQLLLKPASVDTVAAETNAVNELRNHLPSVLIALERR